MLFQTNARMPHVSYLSGDIELALPQPNTMLPRWSWGQVQAAQRNRRDQVFVAARSEKINDRRHRAMVKLRELYHSEMVPNRHMAWVPGVSAGSRSNDEMPGLQRRVR